MSCFVQIVSWYSSKSSCVCFIIEQSRNDIGQLMLINICSCFWNGEGFECKVNKGFRVFVGLNDNIKLPVVFAINGSDANCDVAYASRKLFSSVCSQTMTE